MAQTYARFRLTSVADVADAPNGLAPDGEVEDYAVPILGLDFGDAPDDSLVPTDYPTLLTSDGARHAVVAGVHLGAAIDDEDDGQPSIGAIVPMRPCRCRLKHRVE